MYSGRTIAHTIHGMLLAFPLALFSSALLSDIVYLRTSQIQWTNFSAWLIVGALVFGGVVLAWSLVELALGFRSPLRRRKLLYTVVLAVMWVLGLMNAFKHSQDGWSSVGAFGLILSILCTLLVFFAAAIAGSGFTHREVAR